MNMQKDELQELWNGNNAAAGNVPGQTDALSRGSTNYPDTKWTDLICLSKGRSEVDRLRRSVRRDGWLKIAALIFLGAALPLFIGRLDAAIWGIFGFSLLAVALGIAQVAWSGGWREKNSALPLARALAADLEIWRRRRFGLAVLLGATPALAWQIYQLAYLAMNPGSSARLTNLLFMTAGGPLLWLLASWRQWARLETWLLQIGQALAAFDEAAAAKYAMARKRAARRAAVIAALLLLLLLAGIVLLRMAR
jgi:hypothetical protein